MVKINAYQHIIGLLLFVGLIQSCTFNQRIKDGTTAMQYKQYAVAYDLLLGEYESARNKEEQAQKAYLMGQCKNQLLQYQEAETWYDKSYDLGYGAQALAALAQVQKSREKYPQAIESYRKLTTATGRKQEMDREILLCEQAMIAQQTPHDYLIERFGVNTMVSDYAPVLYEGDFLLFTSERETATGSQYYKWTGEKHSDLFITPKIGSSEVRKFDSAINTIHNEGSACFSADGNTMYFTRCYSLTNGNENCKLMKTIRIGNVWSEPELLPFVREEYQYRHPALIEKDSVLVFSGILSSDENKTDLYYCSLNYDGTWSEPEAFPSTINSIGNEMFPTSDGDTLYFSSDFLPGLGGFDIFKTYLKKNLSWSTPINVGYPINSGGDDFSYIVDRRSPKLANVLIQGYFSSSRVGAGKDDIFSFKKLKPKTPVNQHPQAIKTKEIYLAVQLYTHTYNVDDDPNSGILGKVSLGQSYVKVIPEDKGEVIVSKALSNGIFVQELETNANFKVIGSKPGYLNASKNVAIDNVEIKPNEKSVTVNVELILDKIYEDKEINIPNIYYEYDKWDITSESKPILDQLAIMLNENPQVDIELVSHTDCRGDDNYNQDLSQKRAQSVVNYLALKAVKVERLKPTGKGETTLIDNCPCDQCSEAQHLSNRRTTFRISPKKR
jgi:peptidoglycan-associated lipoprotein